MKKLPIEFILLILIVVVIIAIVLLSNKSEIAIPATIGGLSAYEAMSNYKPTSGGYDRFKRFDTYKPKTYNTSKAHCLFDGYPKELVDKIQLDNVAEYSVTCMSVADQVAKQAKSVYDEIFKPENDVTLLDMTACVGGDTVAYSKVFQKIISCEVDPGRFNMLKHNLDVLSVNNVETVNVDSVKYLEDVLKNNGSNESKTKIDIVYMDPPWGGTPYKDMKGKIELKLGNKSVNEIINDCIGNGIKMIILKAPKDKIAPISIDPKYKFKIQKAFIKGYQKLDFFFILNFFNIDVHSLNQIDQTEDKDEVLSPIVIADNEKLVFDGNNLIHAIGGAYITDKEFAKALDTLSESINSIKKYDKHIVIKNNRKAIGKKAKKEYFQDFIKLSKKYRNITYDIAFGSDPTYSVDSLHYLKGRDDFLALYLSKDGYAVSKDNYRDFDLFKKIEPFEHCAIYRGNLMIREIINPKYFFENIYKPSASNHIKYELIKANKGKVVLEIEDNSENKTETNQKTENSNNMNQKEGVNEQKEDNDKPKKEIDIKNGLIAKHEGRNVMYIII